MALKVVISGRSMAPLNLLTEAGFEVVEGEANTTEELIEITKDADGALIGIWPLHDRQVLEACPKLKVVSRMGVGVDSIDLAAATELGILACNTPGANTTEVADHAMAMLLAQTRLLAETGQYTKAGGWSDNPAKMNDFRREVRRVAGNTMGIIGFGNIGRAFATRIKGFGPEQIIAYDPYVPQTVGDLYGVRMVDLDTLLTQSDFITIHTPATEETHHLINADSLAKMKSTAILINCARGPIVDPVALHAGLRDGEIESAGIDVTEFEPVDAEDPLLGLDNLLITPHLAGWSPTFIEQSGQRQVENVIRVLTGEKPHGLANPEVIKTIAVMRATDPGRWEGIPDFSTAITV